LPLLFLLANGTNQAVGDEQFRSWTARTGTYQTEAIFAELKDGKVTLKKEGRHDDQGSA